MEYTGWWLNDFNGQRARVRRPPPPRVEERGSAQHHGAAREAVEGEGAGEVGGVGKKGGQDGVGGEDDRVGAGEDEQVADRAVQAWGA